MTKKSSKSVGKKSSKPSASRERRLNADDFDEIDDFAAQRERIGLEDSEIDSEEDYATFDEEAILNVPDSKDFEEESDESQDVPNIRKSKASAQKAKFSALRVKSAEKGQKEKSRLNRLASTTNDSDDDILYDRLHREDSDDEENSAAVWGKNRKNYYAEDESADAVEEEAQEARRLQKKKLSALKFDDFVGVDGETEFARNSKSSHASSQKKTLQFDDLEEFEPIKDEIENSSDDEDLIEEDMGEFLALLKDFKDRLHLLRTQLQPLLQRAKESKMPTSSGLSFLQLKYHLMLGYCSSVVYYLMLKGSAGKVQGHPVIRKMLRYRLMLEKIRPLEIKMRFQIEKLLQPQQDETRFRPNPNAMAVDEKADSDDNADGNDGKYRVPKLAPVFYPEDDKEAVKAKRDEDRLSRAASKSRLLAELRGELDDAPEEQSIDPVRMSSRVTTDHRSTAREAYEEENFVRFQVSKKEKRRLETASKPLDELDDLDEFFGELEEINETVANNRNSSSNDKKKTKKSESIAAYLNEINDGNNSSREAESSRPAKYHGSDESDIEDDIQSDKRANRDQVKRQKRQEQLSAQREARGPVSYRPISDLKSTNPRPASYNMIKNKGLTPSRSKEQRNPRVKQRVRYEKAVKKHSSARGGKLTSDTSKPYSGENTGIRTNLTKSVRFK